MGSLYSVNSTTGNITSAGSETLSATTNQLVLGTTNTTTISATAPSASRIYTIPDVGASANMLLDKGNYTLSGTWTNATLVTPALGTPTALVGTNITGTASGLTAGNVTTNANLTGVITSVGNATSIASQTGTGTKFVVDTSPTLITPNLGTPSTLVLTNATGTPTSIGLANGTGLSLTTGVTGTLPVGNGGTGVTSSTGTVNVVLSNSPTLVTPNLGTPSTLVLTNATGLPVAGGGTGLATLTAHDVLVGNTTSAVTLVSPSTSGFVLTSAGVSADPAFKPSGIGNVVATATTGTVTPDASTGNTFSTAVSGTVTYDGPTNGVDGQKITFRVINDATHSVTFATGSGNFRFGTDITSYTNSVSKTDYVGCIWNTSANVWDIVSVIQGF